MCREIPSYSLFYYLVDNDKQEHKLRDIAILFLEAMNDWPALNKREIVDFIKEVKYYFGEPLTIEKIKEKKFDGENAWQVEAGQCISDLIDISTRFCNQPDFDSIVDSMLSYYGAVSIEINIRRDQINE